MKAITTLFTWSLLAVLLAGCEQVIEIDLPPHTPQIVVNSTFSTDSVVYAQISVSKQLQDTAQIQVLSDASVVLLEDGLPFDTLQFTSNYFPGAYRGSRIPSAGKNYTLKASRSGFPTVEGNDLAPFPVAIENVTFQDSVPDPVNEGVWDEITFSFSDAGTTDDFYVAGIQLSDSVEVVPGQWEVYTMMVGFITDDPIMERDFTGNVVSFTDDSFQGGRRSIRMKVNHDDIAYGTAEIVLLHTSENYFRYLRSINAYEETQFNPFAEPVIIHSNMTPQLGIFAGYSRSTALVPR